MTDSAGEPAPPSPARPGVPVVGMVGAGPLARMTGQAAIGLGVGFRVLAGSVTDSAAQVLAGAVVGDYRSLDDLRAFAAGCDVLTFGHEHVPGQGAHVGHQALPGRTIGHVTVTGDRAYADHADLADRARRAASYLRWGREDGD